MKRNRSGINLDEGVPLVSKPEFELLYVPCFAEITAGLLAWIEVGERPLLVGGQIGSGKSTLINKAIQEVERAPDVTLHFDQATLNLDAGDFWGITLAGLIEAALTHGVDLTFCKLPAELGPYQGDDWQALLEELRPRSFSMSSFNDAMAMRKKVAENAPYMRTVIAEIGQRLEGALGRPLFLFVSGVDKFDPQSTAYFSMQDALAALAQFKTLYEVNAAHLFHKAGSPLAALERLFIPVLNQDELVSMLAKRMGVYAQPLGQELATIAHWSGGNPRQAIRLLDHFETARKKRKRTVAESLAWAIRESSSDFFAYSARPSTDLMNTVHRSATIKAVTFSLPGDKETALKALYGNWIFLGAPVAGDSWPVQVNPLVKSSFDRTNFPEDPETRLLRDYAAGSGISETGIGLHRLDPKTGHEKSGEQLLWEFIAAGVEQPLHTNLSETLDLLGDALLSTDRADRVLIAYRDAPAMAAARAYLFAKANSYEYQRCQHIMVTGGPEAQPLAEIASFLTAETDIFSIEFAGSWEPGQLEALDKLRDRFVNLQMLWWIPIDDLKRYLPCWTQLRQLFEILVLDDELLGSISAAEVQADLAFFADLVDHEKSSEANVVTNLKIVLDYLQTSREGGNHG